MSGSARGRPLATPRGGLLRPTTGRVKGAIFSMLEADAARRGFEGDAEYPYQRVLDLYAGSGALGIEALSRGAASVDFVESDSAACVAIHTNLVRTGLADRGRIHTLPVERALSTLRAAYDLILADPPYTDPSLLALLEKIGTSELLSEDGIFVLEYSQSFLPPPQAGRLHLDRFLRHGSTRVGLFRADPDSRQPSPSKLLNE